MSNCFAFEQAYVLRVQNGPCGVGNLLMSSPLEAEAARATTSTRCPLLLFSNTLNPELSTYPQCISLPPLGSPPSLLLLLSFFLPLYLTRSCMVVLIPDDPFTGQWGRGSRLVFRAALNQLKPVFVICSSCPKNSDHYRVIGSCLYGAQGFWVVPHTISDGGLCDEEF